MAAIKNMLHMVKIMIDIHTHILPGVDDGSESMDMSLQMLRLAQKGGTKVVTVTPHNNLPGVKQDIKHLEKVLLKLRQEVENAGISVDIACGMELFATWDLPDILRNGNIWTFNNTRYFLTEFDFDEEPEFCNRVLERCADIGFYPVIAHPERYSFVQNTPDIVYNWIKKGYGIQVNKGSLSGRFGRRAKRAVDILMECGLVSCIASDAHFPWVRTPYMEDVFDMVVDEYGKEYAYMVFYDNPYRILNGQPLVGLKPILP